jgi:hypothetical protein
MIPGQMVRIRPTAAAAHNFFKGSGGDAESSRNVSNLA